MESEPAKAGEETATTATATRTTLPTRHLYPAQSLDKQDSGTTGSQLPSGLGNGFHVPPHMLVLWRFNPAIRDFHIAQSSVINDHESDDVPPSRRSPALPILLGR
ncbi:hypothetical protein NMY22_g20259 [Coprinellus aureogranulatus]|nr:hypothetical protein NMY22_g20259 [Coprinellus aureogranulatus]